MSAPAPERERAPALFIATLLLLVFSIYAQTRQFAFAGIDDDEYVYENPVVTRGLSVDGVVWAFGGPHAGNWHPVTWLSHMADVGWFGLDAGRHHLASVALHAINVVLLFTGLRLLTGATWRAFFVASLFAAHPLNVENVAWIAERKSLLGTAFFFLMLFAWVAWLRRRNPALYGLALALFALSLMSKSMAVSAPLLMLLLDVWPLRRISPGSRRIGALLYEKLPFFLLACVFAFVTIVAQGQGGAVAAGMLVPVGERLLNAPLSVLWYLWKALVPTALSVYYPHPSSLGEQIEPVAALLSGVVLFGATVLAVMAARVRPLVLAGWLWFLVSLVPVIGLVQVGLQSRADRYAYIPLIGVFIIVTWGVADVAARMRGERYAGYAAAAFLVVFAFVAHRQASHWRTVESLFGHAVALDSRNWFAWNNLGKAAQMRGDLRQALRCFETSASLAPMLPQFRYNVGATLAAGGRYAEAVPWYQSALQLNEQDHNVWSNLAIAFLATNRPTDSVAAASRALALQPGFGHALYALTLAHAARGDGRSAVASYAELKKADAQLAEEVAPQLRLMGFAPGRIGR